MKAVRDNPILPAVLVLAGACVLLVWAFATWPAPASGPSEALQEWPSTAEVSNSARELYEGLTATNFQNYPSLTTNWIGHPVVSNNDPYTPSQGWTPDYQIGLRSDGVVVWRRTPK